MRVFDDLWQHIRFMIGPLVGLSLIGYFSFHVVQGERGILAWQQLERQIEDAQAELGQIRSQRQILEHRVSLLHHDSLDADLLDEVVRRNLGYGRRDEIVIHIPDLSDN